MSQVPDAPRGRFSRIGFLLAAIGSAVGLGNIWRFPYLTGQEGGAAFVLIYLGFLLLMAVPILQLEIAIGRATKRSPVAAYAALGGRSWRWAGLLGVVACVVILSYYLVISGWVLSYAVNAFAGTLAAKIDYTAHFKTLAADVTTTGLYGLLLLVAAAFVNAQGVSGGLERANTLLMPLLVVLLFALVGYVLTLPGAWAGVAYYLVPRFGAVTLQTVSAAMGQAFFSLSLGVGGMLTYGSYLGQTENLPRLAWQIGAADFTVAFMAGLLIFPLCYVGGVAPSSGPGLVFIALPQLFTQVPGASAVAGLFFCLLAFAAFTSIISLLEVPVAYCVDSLGWKRRRAVLIVAIGVGLAGLLPLHAQGGASWLTHFWNGKSYLEAVDYIFSDLALPIGGVAIVWLVWQRWGTRALFDQLELGAPGYARSVSGRYLRWAVAYCLIPLLTVLVLLKLLGLG